MNRTRVKICGITRVEDAVAAIDAGADAVGLVFWEGSKRAIDNVRARAIVEQIPASVSTVGVFVDASLVHVLKTADETGISVAQLCGKVGSGNWNSVPRYMRLLRMLTIASSKRPDATERMSGVSDYLLDNGAVGQHGGTGQSFDWGLAEAFREWGRIWLAGGLRPDNVGEAISVVRPHAVDVSSGVEISPGVKSPELIRAFIDAVHHADHAIAKAKAHAR